MLHDLEQTIAFNRALPERIRRYLHDDRGITDNIIDAYPIQTISGSQSFGREGFEYKLTPLVFGWRPNPLAYICLVAVLAPLFGYLGGRAAELSLEDTSSDQSPLCRVSAIHWLWLWFPLSSWAFIFTSMAYLFWLTIAGMLHSPDVSCIALV